MEVRVVHLPVLVRRGHRILASLWLLIVAIGFIYSFAAGGVEPPDALGALVGLLLVVMAITGIYLLARPWVQRYRARGSGS